MADHDVLALAFQKAVQDELRGGGPLAGGLTSQDVGAGADHEYAKNTGWYRAVARAMYEETQASFQAQGITRVNAWRGVTLKAVDTPAAVQAIGIGETTQVQVELQPASSLSSSKTTARSFAGSTRGGNTGVMLHAAVPVQHILGTCVTGVGCLNGWEFVVMNAPGTINVTKV
jgi:hypothetical protein